MSFAIQTAKGLIEKLTEGEKIHLVNHIYKHYGIYPTKLKGVVEEADVRELLPVGTLVRIVYTDDTANCLQEGQRAFICARDPSDSQLPYEVSLVDQYGEEIREWAPAKQLEVIN